MSKPHKHTHVPKQINHEHVTLYCFQGFRGLFRGVLNICYDYYYHDDYYYYYCYYYIVIVILLSLLYCYRYICD